MSPPAEFGDLYDEHTLARLRLARDSALVASRRPVSGWRNRTATGAILTGLVLGYQEVFDPPEPEQVVEEIDGSGLNDPDLPVVYHHVPGAPRQSVAVVRCRAHRLP